MTPEEYLYCIKYINSLAHVVIWGEGEEMYPKWDDAHVGAKPTIEECEAVLPQVQAELAAQKEARKIKKSKGIGDMVVRFNDLVERLNQSG